MTTAQPEPSMNEQKRIAASVINRAREVLYKIGYKPIGHAEASDRDILDDITVIARDAYAEIVKTEREWCDIGGGYVEAVPATPSAAASGWVRCSDRTPSDHGIYVTYRPLVRADGSDYAASTGIDFYDNDDKEWRGSYHGPSSVTHWMPLPKGPAL